jgi:hypothetical protein
MKSITVKMKNKNQKITNINKLEDEPFDYQIFKDKVQVSYYGKSVMMLKSTRAQNLIKKIDKAEKKEVQLILAKITGNFKRGNEKN